jgi:hypothetical protein
MRDRMRRPRQPLCCAVLWNGKNPRLTSGVGRLQRRPKGSRRNGGLPLAPADVAPTFAEVEIVSPAQPVRSSEARSSRGCHQRLGTGCGRTVVGFVTQSLMAGVRGELISPSTRWASSATAREGADGVAPPFQANPRRRGFDRRCRVCMDAAGKRFAEILANHRGVPRFQSLVHLELPIGSMDRRLRSSPGPWTSKSVEMSF